MFLCFSEETIIAKIPKVLNWSTRAYAATLVALSASPTGVRVVGPVTPRSGFHQAQVES